MPTTIRACAAALLMIQIVSACAPDTPQNSLVTNQHNAADSEPSESGALKPNEKLIVAFGDSLYAGYGLAQGEGFPADLEKALKARGLAVRVHNAGVSGDTTGAGQARLAFTLDGLPRKPDLVIVGLGGNDMLRGLDPKIARENLTAICSELQRRGIPIMLTGMVAAPNLGKDYAAQFNAIYADLSKRFDAPLYPFFLDGVVGHEELMLPDHIHPNARGIDLIVGRVAPVVERAVRTPSSVS